jgi:hypothetical protein
MISWQNSAQYDVGVSPSVAGTPSGCGWIPEVHQAYVDLNGAPLLVDFSPLGYAWQYDVGVAPAIANRLEQ